MTPVNMTLDTQVDQAIDLDHAAYTFRNKLNHLGWIEERCRKLQDAGLPWQMYGSAMEEVRFLRRHYEALYYTANLAVSYMLP